MSAHGWTQSGPTVVLCNINAEYASGNVAELRPSGFYDICVKSTDGVARNIVLHLVSDASQAGQISLPPYRCNENNPPGFQTTCFSISRSEFRRANENDAAANALRLKMEQQAGHGDPIDALPFPATNDMNSICDKNVFSFYVLAFHSNNGYLFRSRPLFICQTRANLNLNAKHIRVDMSQIVTEKSKATDRGPASGQKRRRDEDPSDEAMIAERAKLQAPPCLLCHSIQFKLNFHTTDTDATWIVTAQSEVCDISDMYFRRPFLDTSGEVDHETQNALPSFVGPKERFLCVAAYMGMVFAYAMHVGGDGHEAHSKVLPFSTNPADHPELSREMALIDTSTPEGGASTPSMSPAGSGAASTPPSSAGAVDDGNNDTLFGLATMEDWQRDALLMSPIAHALRIRPTTLLSRHQHIFLTGTLRSNPQAFVPAPPQNLELPYKLIPRPQIMSNPQPTSPNGRFMLGPRQLPGLQATRPSPVPAHAVGLVSAHPLASPPHPAVPSEQHRPAGVSRTPSTAGSITASAHTDTATTRVPGPSSQAPLHDQPARARPDGGDGGGSDSESDGSAGSTDADEDALQHDEDEDSDDDDVPPGGSGADAAAAPKELEPEADPRSAQPGERHDNDPEDFTKISLLPPASELTFTEMPPYLPRANTDLADEAGAQWLYLERLFRLLRWDMIAPICRAFQKKEKRLEFSRPVVGEMDQRGIVSLTVTLSDGLIERVRQAAVTPIGAISPHKLKEYFTLGVARRLLGIESLLMVIYKGDIMGVCLVVERNDEMWATCLRDATLTVGVVFFGTDVDRTLTRLHIRPDDPEVTVIQSSAAYYAYEPVLRQLQRLARAEPLKVPFADEFIFGRSSGRCNPFGPLPAALSPQLVIQINGDVEQEAGLRRAFEGPLSLIQGPPGTGKSRVGALIVKALRELVNPAEPIKILAVCYTNHAVDNFLLTLMESFDVADQEIIRLGSSPRINELIKPLTLTQRRIAAREADEAKGKQKKPFDKKTWRQIEPEIRKIEQEMDDLTTSAKIVGTINSEPTLSWRDVAGYLQARRPEIFMQFQAPEQRISSENLWNAWRRGVDKHEAWGGYTLPADAEDGVAVLDDDEVASDEEEGDGDGTQSASGARGGSTVSSEVRPPVNVWELDATGRRFEALTYRREARRARAAESVRIMGGLRAAHEDKRELYLLRDLELIKGCSVIGATSTAAARNTRLLVEAGVNVVIVEEAAEIREADLLAVLACNPKMVVLIGDHEQLRPKLENYYLSYDSHNIGRTHSLDVSLFERLVTERPAGVPFTQLCKQYRMRPEFSSLIRNCKFYPNLEDTPVTANYPDVAPLMKNLIFIDYPSNGHQETKSDDPEVDTKTRQNELEVAWVTHTAFFLLQRGYKRSDIAIVTPYAGQLVKLRAAFKELGVRSYMSNEDLAEIAKEESLLVAMRDDSSDGERVGSAPPPPVHVNAIRMATVDNYQGEEAKIIIVSLVRSNPAHRIGFLARPNRVNVLLSRAKEGLIMVGDRACFEDFERKRGLVNKRWRPVFAELDRAQSVYSGLPIRCEHTAENHGAATVLASPTDIKARAEDGGCGVVCEAPMTCGHQHKCGRTCHGQEEHKCKAKLDVEGLCAAKLHPVEVYCDRSRVVPCEEEVNDRCPQGHKRTRHCYDTDRCDICQRTELRHNRLSPSAGASVVPNAAAARPQVARRARKHRTPLPASTAYDCGVKNILAAVERHQGNTVELHLHALKGAGFGAPAVDAVLVYAAAKLGDEPPEELLNRLNAVLPADLDSHPKKEGAVVVKYVQFYLSRAANDKRAATALAKQVVALLAQLPGLNWPREWRAELTAAPEAT